MFNRKFQRRLTHPGAFLIALWKVYTIKFEILVQELAHRF